MTCTSKFVPTLLVHGGAWAIPENDREAHQAGVRRALEAGYAVLAGGGAAVDAVEAAVTILEDDPTFDAGRGSFLTSDGRVQLDALLMDGGRMKAGGVACVERLRNPIQAARLVLEKSPHVYFVGKGAEEFAASHGMPLIDNMELVLDRERDRLAAAQQRAAAGLADATFSGIQDDKSPETGAPTRDRSFDEGIGVTDLRSRVRDQGSEIRGHESESGDRETGTRAQGSNISNQRSRIDTQEPTGEAQTSKGGRHDEGAGSRNALGADPTQSSHDTVGAVALDAAGNLAAATSTGGTLNKTPGRVGDSSLIGCGCYADNLSAAVSLTGWGEPIMKLVLGKWATDRVAAGTPPEIAARDAIAYLYNRLGGHGGIILLGPDGRFGFAHNTPAMAWGRATPAGLETGLEV